MTCKATEQSVAFLYALEIRTVTIKGEIKNSVLSTEKRKNEISRVYKISIKENQGTSG